jgi:histidine triad (HIT) family protein
METIFTKIINKEIPSYEVYDDAEFYAFLDINPTNPGHTLLIPKEANKCFLKESDETISKLMIKAKEIGLMLLKKLDAQGIKYVLNNGEASGQEVFHTHLHIIPYYDKEDKRTTEEIFNILKK